MRLVARIIAFLADDDVIFVSDDKAFFEGRDYSKGLATVLREEADKMPHRLRLLQGMIGLLKELRADVRLDEDALSAAYLAKQKDAVERLLARHSFALGRRLSLRRRLFATENAGLLFLDFAMEFEVLDATEQGRGNGVLGVKGNGVYDATGAQFRQLRPDFEELRYRLPDGAEQVAKSAYAYAGPLVIGHGEVSREARYQLE